MVKKTVGELSATAEKKSVYRRDTDELYIKLNKEFHVKVKYDKNEGMWLGDGLAEELDPDEVVEVIQE